MFKLGKLSKFRKESHHNGNANFPQQSMNSIANPPDLSIVDNGIPYFPFSNNPLKKGQKLITTHTLHTIFPTPVDTCGADDVNFGPKKLVANAVKCTNKRVVGGLQILETRRK